MVSAALRQPLRVHGAALSVYLTLLVVLHLRPDVRARPTVERAGEIRGRSVTWVSSSRAVERPWPLGKTLRGKSEDRRTAPTTGRAQFNRSREPHEDPTRFLPSKATGETAGLASAKIFRHSR